MATKLQYGILAACKEGLKRDNTNDFISKVMPTHYEIKLF
jgi:hypothetical protein